MRLDTADHNVRATVTTAGAGRCRLILEYPQTEPYASTIRELLGPMLQPPEHRRRVRRGAGDGERE